MQTYRTSVTITDPKQVVVKDVPFSVGDQVEVIIRPLDDAITKKRAALLTRLNDLFQRTQEQAAAAGITDEDIAAEIDAYRSGR